MLVHITMVVVRVQAFSVVFQNAIDRSEKASEVKQRVMNLIDSITHLVFMYTTRGLFERDKLIFTSQVTFQVSCSAELKIIYLVESQPYG